MKIGGSRVLVTGASRGIGRAMARGFAQAGADVALVARSAGALDELAAELGGRAYPTDLTNAGQVADLFDRVELDGEIDIVINNAGDECIGRFENMSAETLRFIIDLNVWAVAEVTRQAVSRMVKRGSGHIVNVSSYAGVGVPPSLATYAATKAFITHHTANLRAELETSGIGFTTIEIGEVADTGMMEKGRTDPKLAAGFDRLYALHLSRLITPDEITAQTLTAVERGKPHVRLPRRLAGLAALAELPRRLTKP